MPAQQSKSDAIVLRERNPRRASKIGVRVLAALVDYSRVVVIGSDTDTETASAIVAQYNTEGTLLLQSDTTAQSTRSNVVNASKQAKRPLTAIGITRMDGEGNAAYSFTLRALDTSEILALN